uniref:Small integral membrane protein 15 n=1 Tax=Onchocerca volvulus TaxID=6282 RepID=A0A2K6VKD2_ONCVO
MVELSGKSTLQHSFDNSVFIIPAVIVVAIVALVTYKLTSSIKLKQRREEEKRRRREEKSRKRS